MFYIADVERAPIFDDMEEYTDYASDLRDAISDGDNDPDFWTRYYDNDELALELSRSFVTVGDTKDGVLEEYSLSEILHFPNRVQKRIYGYRDGYDSPDEIDEEYPQIECFLPTACMVFSKAVKELDKRLEALYNKKSISSLKTKFYVHGFNLDRVFDFRELREPCVRKYHTDTWCKDLDYPSIDYVFEYNATKTATGVDRRVTLLTCKSDETVIKIPYGVTGIATLAFASCLDLQCVYVPSTTVDFKVPNGGIDNVPIPLSAKDKASMGNKQGLTGMEWVLSNPKTTMDWKSDQTRRKIQGMADGVDHCFSLIEVSEVVEDEDGDIEDTRMFRAEYNTLEEDYEGGCLAMLVFDKNHPTLRDICNEGNSEEFELPYALMSDSMVYNTEYRV